MPIDLYHVHASGPCRSVRLVASKIGVDLNLKFLDLFIGEQFKPEFLKMNPQHTVPTIDDNGFYLSESYAICSYLADQYAKDDSLYPKDPKKRAIVNQHLFFDAGVLYKSFFDYYLAPIWMGATKEFANLEKIDFAFGFLEKFLEDQNYIAGNKLTIADIIILTSVSNFSVVDHDISKYKNTCKWFKKVKCEIPKYEEINGEGLKIYRDLLNKAATKL